MTLNCIRVGIYQGPVVQSPISANPVLTLYVLLIVYPGFTIVLIGIVIWTVLGIYQGSVVQSPISANPGLTP